MLKLWLMAILLCASAAGLDSHRQISQYAHTAWRVQDGAFSGTPHAITQTLDGYLWIGTESGLVRFDGVRFVPWTPPEGKRLPTSRVYSLLGASDGSLWIGTGVGLARLKDGEFVNYSATRGFVESILEDSSGTIWMTRSQVGADSRGPLCRVIDKEIKCYGASAGIPFRFSQPLAKDSLGNLWIGSDLGVCRWKDGSANTYLLPALQRGKGLRGVSAIAAGADGAIWVGIGRAGRGLGLQRLVNGTWKPYTVPGMDGTALEVTAFLTDRDGALWIGTENQGIYRLSNGNADHFRAADGLSSDSVGGFYEDREGDLWVVTSRGIDRFHETAVVSFSIREGLTAENVGSVLAARDGTVWIANSKGLDVLRNGKLSAIDTITDITLDATGNGAPNASVVGIFYQESSGTVNRVATRNQIANGSGVGIWAEGGGGTPSVTVENSSIHNFDGIGIYAEAIPGFVGSTATITAVIESNDLDGSGALSGGANYGVGIQAFDGVAATVTGNVVVNAGTGIQASFTSGTSQPSGTISSNVVADSMFDGIFVGGSVTVSSNKIWGNNIGIEIPNSATVQSNSLFNNQTGIQFDCSTIPNVHSNTINDSVTGLASVPDSVGSSNTYVNVGTIRTSGC